MSEMLTKLRDEFCERIQAGFERNGITLDPSGLGEAIAERCLAVLKDPVNAHEFEWLIMEHLNDPVRQTDKQWFMDRNGLDFHSLTKPPEVSSPKLPEEAAGPRKAPTFYTYPGMTFAEHMAEASGRVCWIEIEDKYYRIDPGAKAIEVDRSGKVILAAVEDEPGDDYAV